MFAASDTQINDDLVACLVLFGWITKQPLFADLTNINIRKILAQKNEDYILENLSPFGFIDDGLSEFRQVEINNSPQRIDGVMSVDDWINS